MSDKHQDYIIEAAILGFLIMLGLFTVDLDVNVNVSDCKNEQVDKDE